VQLGPVHRRHVDGEADDAFGQIVDKKLRGFERD